MHPDVVLALRVAVSRSGVDDFWIIWSRSALLGACWRACPTDAGFAALPSLEEVCYVFVTGVLEAGLLVAGGSRGYSWG